MLVPQGNHGFSGSVADRWMGALAGCASTGWGGTEIGLATKAFRAPKGAVEGANGAARHGHPQGSNGARQREPQTRSGWRLSPDVEHAAETRRRGRLARGAKRIEVRRPGAGSNAGPQLRFGARFARMWRVRLASTSAALIFPPGRCACRVSQVSQVPEVS